jgi:hypothetical protein
MKSTAARNAIKQQIMRALPPNASPVISRITMPQQIPTIIPSGLRQTVKIAIQPTPDGNRLNTGNMIQNPFQSIQESTVGPGAIAVIATPILPTIHSRPALIVTITTKLT